MGEESVAPAQSLNPTCGLLWWVISEWETRRLDDETLEALKKGGADAAFVEKISRLKGRDLDRDAFLAELNRLFATSPSSRRRTTSPTSPRGCESWWRSPRRPDERRPCAAAAGDRTAASIREPFLQPLARGRGCRPDLAPGGKGPVSKLLLSSGSSPSP
jgi:hypothetical protein